MSSWHAAKENRAGGLGCSPTINATQCSARCFDPASSSPVIKKTGDMCRPVPWKAQRRRACCRGTTPKRGSRDLVWELSTIKARTVQRSGLVSVN